MGKRGRRAGRVNRRTTARVKDSSAGPRTRCPHNHDLSKTTVAKFKPIIARYIEWHDTPSASNARSNHKASASIAVRSARHHEPGGKEDPVQVPHHTRDQIHYNNMRYIIFARQPTAPAPAQYSKLATQKLYPSFWIHYHNFLPSQISQYDFTETMPI
jgi:hypothetical protein